MDSRIVRRVLAGGLWLDMISPGWQDRVDWDRLNMTNTSMCVAGYAFADLAQEEISAGGFRWLTGYDMLREVYALTPAQRAALGFTTDDEDDQGWADPWNALDEAWRALWGRPAGLPCVCGADWLEGHPCLRPSCGNA